MFKKKNVFVWIAGLVTLFLINILIEALALPAMGLDNTPKNDIYFMSWWAVTGLWFFFGLILLNHYDQVKQSNQTA